MVNESGFHRIIYSFVFNRRKRKNSTIEKSIEIRAYQKGQDAIYLNTGIRIDPKSWDERNKRVKPLHSLADVYNERLYQLCKELETYETQAIKKHGFFKVQDLKRFNGLDVAETISFNQFCLKELDNSIDEASTKKAHKSRLNIFLQKFKCDKVVYFEDITVSLIRQYDRYLKTTSSIQSQNTIHGYHKVLKTYINKAIAEGFMKVNPYSSYKVERERDENIKREWLTLEEVRKIEALKIADGDPLNKIRDFFLISVWCGFRFCTVLSLTPEHIKQTENGLIIEQLKTAKTKKRLFFPLDLIGEKNANGCTKPEQLVKSLLDRRAKETCPGHDFKKLPFFKFSLPHYNRQLKVIAQFAHIDKKISSHIGRRTFIDVMRKDFNLPLETVQLLAQHSDIRTTMKYMNQKDEAITSELKKAKIVL